MALSLIILEAYAEWRYAECCNQVHYANCDNEVDSLSGVKCLSLASPDCGEHLVTIVFVMARNESRS